jgi:hypothetical protein
MIHPNDPEWIGKKFNMLTVVGAVHNGRRWLWECECDCGGHSIAYPNQVMRGKTKTCGCGRSVTFREMHYKHGESSTRLYGIWKGMINRCNPNNTHSHHYGERGITVCDEWREYVNFRDWARDNGYDENLTIERIDVNSNYCPQNCKWIPFSEQPRNTRNSIIVTHDGISAPVSWWADKRGLRRSSVYYRISRGMSPEDALGF